MSLLASFVPLLGRVLVAVLFLWSGAAKLSHPARAAAAIAAVHVPYPMAASLAAGALEALGGAALVLGLRARSAAVLLFLYVAAATWLFHWPAEMVHVMKNLAIMGALLGVAANGPGPLALER